VVGDVHLLEDGCAVVGDRDVAIGGDQNLVEATGTERALDDVCDGASGEDMRLDSLVAVLSLLLALAVRRGLLGGSVVPAVISVEVNALPNNDERSALLVLRHHSWTCISIRLRRGEVASVGVYHLTSPGLVKS